jgi:hypothetical protein
MKMRLIASVLLSVLIGLGVNVYGEDLTGLNDVPTQVIEIEKSGAVAILQKQPTNEKQTQVIRVKKAGGFLLIQINGKVKDYNTGLLDK